MKPLDWMVGEEVESVGVMGDDYVRITFVSGHWVEFVAAASLDLAWENDPDPGEGG